MNAPCGHPGEVVVGTYVRCIRGCEGAAPPSKRGIEGHVTDCACVGCGNCRRVRSFHLRAKDGKAPATMGWVGVARPVAELSIFATASKLRHLNAVDVDGRVLASHPIFFDARAGDKLDFTFDPATLSFSSVKHWGKSRLSDYVNITITADKSWKERYAALDHAPEWNRAYPKLDAEIPRAGTTAWAKATALSIPGINAVEVLNGAGVVTIQITRGADKPNDAIQALHAKLTDEGPIAVRWRIENKTPQHIMGHAAVQVKMMTHVWLREEGLALGEIRDKARDLFSERLTREGVDKDVVKTLDARVHSDSGRISLSFSLKVDNLLYGIGLALG